MRILPQPPELPKRVNLPIMNAVEPAKIDKSAAQANDDMELKKAAEDFAGMLFAQMFSEMRGTPDEEGSLFGGEQDTEMFMGFFDQAIGEKYVSTGGNGIAEQLYQQLLKGKNPGA